MQERITRIKELVIVAVCSARSAKTEVALENRRHRQQTEGSSGMAEFFGLSLEDMPKPIRGCAYLVGILIDYSLEAGTLM
jgi:hypothetical protein